MQQLSPTARVILGVLGASPRTGYDIKKLTDVSTRFFWGASYGQIYPELHRLEAEGLVEAEPASGARRRRPYRLTPAGREALHRWLTSDELLHFDVRDEGLLKLFFGDLLSDQEARDLVRRTRAQYEELLDGFRGLAEELESDRTEDDGRFPYVALGYGLAYLEWVGEWWRGLERELDAEG
jgi:PadR family transcriptional regulator, regulatory protein AphA